MSADKKASKAQIVILIALAAAIIASVWFLFLKPETPVSRASNKPASPIAQASTSSAGGSEVVSTNKSFSTDGKTLIETTTVTTKVDPPEVQVVMNEPQLTEDNRELLDLMHQKLKLELDNQVKSMTLEQKKLERELAPYSAPLDYPQMPMNEMTVGNVPETVSEPKEDIPVENEEDKAAKRNESINAAFAQLEIAGVSLSKTNNKAYIKYRGNLRTALIGSSISDFVVKDITNEYVELQNKTFKVAKKLPTPSYSANSPSTMSSGDFSEVVQPMSLPPQINGLPSF